MAYLDAQKWEEAYGCLKLLWGERDYRAVEIFRDAIKKGKITKKSLEFYRMSYDLTAPEVFDDFMLALEWNRPASEQFWLPRREKLMTACNALQDLEDGRLDELFLSMPPRVGKTTLIVFFILWIILRDSERSNLYSSYSDGVVKVFYNGLLEILNDPYTYRWKEIFPERTIASTDAKDLLLNIDRKKRYASFTARSLYGTLNGACDCNGYEIADDLHSGIEEAMSRDRLNAAWFKVDNNFLPRAKEGAKNLWIGTRWSLYDAIARRIDLLENDEKFKKRRYQIVNMPALDENDESNFEYLYGVGFSSDYYQQRRASFERGDDVASWLAQYQCEPIERSGTVFSVEDFRYYNGVLPEGDPDRVFVAVDPAWGGGDYVAAVLIHQYEAELFISDVVYSNEDKRTTQPLVAKLAIDGNASAMYIEGTKTTSSYAEGVQEISRNRDYRLNLQTTVKHWSGVGKSQRIFDRSPDIKENMIFLSADKRKPEYGRFMENVFAFKIEGKNKHDDAPDVLAMAAAIVFSGEAKAIIQKRVF